MSDQSIDPSCLCLKEDETLSIYLCCARPSHPGGYWAPLPQQEYKVNISTSKQELGFIYDRAEIDSLAIGNHASQDHSSVAIVLSHGYSTGQASMIVSK